MKNKLLIIQNYNPNVGDSSVINAMIQGLKKFELQIEVTSFDTKKASVDYNIPAFDWLVSYKKIKLATSKSKKLSYLFIESLWILYSFLWILCFRVGLNLWLPLSKKKIIKSYIRSDVVVLPGGHFFTNLNKFPQVFSHFWGLYFAKLLGKKTMIYAQTIGPFYGVSAIIARLLTNYLIRHTNTVTVREFESYKKYKNFSNVFLTAETVFSLKEDNLHIMVPELELLKKQKRAIVGVTIHHIYYKNFFSRHEYVYLMSSIFDSIIERYNCSVLLIPMESKSIGPADRELANEMKSKMVYKAFFKIIDDEYQPVQIPSIIKQCNLFIGTKTHSIVYGLKTYVPTLAIAYQQKSTEFMRAFNVSENSIPLKDLKLDSFILKFDRIFNNMEKYRTIQSLAHEKVIIDAEKNNTFLLKLFECK